MKEGKLESNYEFDSNKETLLDEEAKSRQALAKLDPESTTLPLHIVLPDFFLQENQGKKDVEKIELLMDLFKKRDQQIMARLEKLKEVNEQLKSNLKKQRQLANKNKISEKEKLKKTNRFLQKNFLPELSEIEAAEFVKIEEALENTFILDVFPCEVHEMQIALVYEAKNKKLIPVEVFLACVFIRYDSKLISAKYWLEEKDDYILSRKRYSGDCLLEAFDHLARNIKKNLSEKANYIDSLALFLKRCKGIQQEKSNPYLHLHMELERSKFEKTLAESCCGSLETEPLDTDHLLLPEVPRVLPCTDDAAIITDPPSHKNFYFLSLLEINFFMSLFKENKNFFSNDISSMDAEDFMRACLIQEICPNNTFLDNDCSAKLLVTFEDILRRARLDYNHSLLSDYSSNVELGVLIKDLKSEIDTYEKKMVPRYKKCSLTGNRLCAEFQRTCLSKLQENLNDLQAEKKACKKKDHGNYQGSIDTCHDMVEKINKFCASFSASLAQEKILNIAKEGVVPLAGELPTGYFFPEKKGSPSFFTRACQVYENCLDTTGLIVACLCFGSKA